MYKYRVVATEICKQGYTVISNKPLTKQQALDKIESENIYPNKNDLYCLYFDPKQSSIESIK